MRQGPQLDRDLTKMNEDLVKIKQSRMKELQRASKANRVLQKMTYINDFDNFLEAELVKRHDSSTTRLQVIKETSESKSRVKASNSTVDQQEPENQHGGYFAALAKFNELNAHRYKKDLKNHSKDRRLHQMKHKSPNNSSESKLKSI